MVDKLRKDGKVAVLYSPGFGAGWYTWNHEYPDLVFDSEIAQAVLDGDNERAESIAKVKYPDAYMGGVEDLRVMWVDEGCQFEIEEYDGNEDVHVIGKREYFMA